MSMSDKYYLIRKVQNIRTDIRAEAFILPEGIPKDRLKECVKELDHVIDILIKQ
jgi:hypothetical protein